MSDPTTTLEPATAPCCQQADAASSGACALCNRPICRRCRVVLNEKKVCAACISAIQAELAQEKASVASLPGAVIGGAIGSLLAAAAWAAIAILSDAEIGYAAVGVGFLAGQGVYLGARRKKSSQMVWIAVLCAIAGLVLAKYFIVAHVLMTKLPAEHLGYLDGRVFHMFTEVLPKLLSPFDALWVLLAIGAARRVVAPTKLVIRRSRAA